MGDSGTFSSSTMPTSLSFLYSHSYHKALDPMHAKSFLILAIAAAFCFGFAFRSAITSPPSDNKRMNKVTGIGGVFFKCKDPHAVSEWYKTHLGIIAGPYGASFEWYQSPDTASKGLTQWTPFKESTKYFDPSTKDFMINYRVEGIESLVEELKKGGVTILDEIQPSEYGKFVHILDLEGNKVELWEPPKS